MANQTPITVVGNITADPEIRFTQAGVPVANLDVAVTERYFDKATNEWKDGDTSFHRVSAWRQLAEHAATSLRKGQQVIVVGTLKNQPYDEKDAAGQPTGRKRDSWVITADAIGPGLQYGTAAFTKTAGGDRAPFTAGARGGTEAFAAQQPAYQQFDPAAAPQQPVYQQPQPTQQFDPATAQQPAYQQPAPQQPVASQPAYQQPVQGPTGVPNPAGFTF